MEAWATKQEDVIRTVRAFIVETFLFGKDSGFLESDSFLEKGILDSTAALELVSFLEGTYGIRIDDQEITLDNLDSLEKVAAFVLRKREKSA